MLGYFGDGPWASRALERVSADERFDVAFITPRHDNRDPELAAWAARLAVPFKSCPNVNEKGFVEWVKNFQPDILVSMSFNQILRGEIINAAPLGFINCHAGKLPFYRGRNPLNWVLINGASEFGVTVHHVDSGIDTGDIIVQNTVPIEPHDNYSTLLDKAHAACADTLVEALVKIATGPAPKVNQSDIHRVGTYFGARRDGDEWIDWSWSSKRIDDFVRGITHPGPGARSLGEHGLVAIYNTELIKNAPKYIGTPGEICGRCGKGIVVKTGDSTIIVTLVSVNNGTGFSEAFMPRWRIGTRLGINQLSEIYRLHEKIEDLESRLASLEKRLKY